MVSVKERIETLQSELAAAMQERDAFKAASDELKALISASEATISEKDIELEAVKAQIAEKDSALAQKDEEIAKAVSDLAEVKAKIELVPAISDISAGAEPVAEGGQAQDVAVDYKAECDKLEGAEKIAFYRKHQKEIDAAYRR
jgi:chromosome segregation ATPase